MYTFPGLLSIQSAHILEITKEMSICLYNENDNYFQTIKSLVQLLKLKLCQDPFSCEQPQDLNKFDNNAKVIELKLHNKNQETNLSGSEEILISLKYSDLYQVDAQNKLSFNFEEISIEQSDSGCQFILQNGFLKQYYVYFERDFTPEKQSLKISFSEIKGSDFGKISLLITVLLVLIVMAAIILGGYIAYRYYSNSIKWKPQGTRNQNGIYEPIHTQV